ASPAVPTVRTCVPSWTVTAPSSATVPKALAAAICSASYSVTGGTTGSSAALGFFAASAAGDGAPGRGPGAAGFGPGLPGFGLGAAAPVLEAASSSAGSSEAVGSAAEACAEGCPAA